MLREFSSGGVVFKKVKGEYLWLIRKTTASDLFPKTFWMLPKGWIDDEGPDIPGPMARGSIKATEEALQKTAIREVLEEGGVKAKIIVKIGTFTFFYNHPVRGKIMKFVTFYLMEWTSDSPKGFDFETSEIAWLPFSEAIKTLSFDQERAVLTDAYELLLH